MENITYLESLPDDILINEFIPNISTANLNNLCRVNSRFRELCKNEEIWKTRIIKEFPEYPKANNISFREFYKFLYLGKSIPVYFHGDRVFYTKFIPENYSKNLQYSLFQIQVILNSNLPSKYYVLYTDKNLFPIALANENKLIRPFDEQKEKYINIKYAIIVDNPRRFRDIRRLLSFPINRLYSSLSMINYEYIFTDYLISILSQYPYYILNHDNDEHFYITIGIIYVTDLDRIYDQFEFYNILYDLKVPPPIPLHKSLGERTTDFLINNVAKYKTSPSEEYLLYIDSWVRSDASYEDLSLIIRKRLFDIGHFFTIPVNS